MAHGMSPSQLRNMIRQAEAKQRRAVEDYNRKVREHNRKVQRAVDGYNQAVRSYNAKVRANRQRLQRELSRLASASRSTTSVRYRSSSEILYRTFQRVEVRAEASAHTERLERFVDLSERETANSVAVTNALAGAEGAGEGDEDIGLNDTAVKDELRTVSRDLDDRWRGALFALDPRNPDAARHFCTSAREVITHFLELTAPDAAVFNWFPACAQTSEGRPTRRARINLLLARQGLAVAEYEEFVERDVDNVLELFQVFNDGTHGSAGKFSLPQLKAMKRRVEDGILFLANLIS